MSGIALHFKGKKAVSHCFPKLEARDAKAIKAMEFVRGGMEYLIYP